MVVEDPRLTSNRFDCVVAVRGLGRTKDVKDSPRATRPAHIDTNYGKAHEIRDKCSGLRRIRVRGPVARVFDDCGIGTSAVQVLIWKADQD